jgi:hypothetical protein
MTFNLHFSCSLLSLPFLPLTISLDCSLGSAEEGYLSMTSRATSTLALSADRQDLETIPGFKESRLCVIGPKKKKKKKNPQTDHD